MVMPVQDDVEQLLHQLALEEFPGTTLVSLVMNKMPSHISWVMNKRDLDGRCCGSASEATTS